MRIKLLAFASSLLLISNSSAGIPQSPSSTTSSSQAAQRDPQAISALQRAIVALGGQAAIGSASNAVLRGTISPAATATAVEAGSFKWEYDFSGSSYEFRKELTVNGVTKILASGHGSPAFNSGTKTLAVSSFVSLASPPFHLPAVLLLRELGNANYSIQFVENITISSHPVIHVRTSVNLDSIQTVTSPQDWYIDGSTGLPLRVRYRVPNTRDAFDFETQITDFSNYQSQNGILVPVTLVTSDETSVLFTATITTISINVPVPSTEFDLPVGGAQ